MHIGPLGSTIHVLRADAGTVTEFARVDWNRWFPRVCLDPVLGLVTLMTPSRLHEDLGEIFADIVHGAASAFTGASKDLRHTRLRGRDDPPDTGMEADGAFYLGARARDYCVALAEGDAAADAFVERTPPDLVVEAEITNADEGKIGRYAEMGVRELWRLHGRKGTRELRVEFLALRPGAEPRELAASEALGGLTADDVREAVDGVRFSLTLDERAEAVARIVRRRRRASVRVREDERPYASRSGYSEPMAAHDASTGIGDATTMHTGPLGSVVHVLRADAGTVAELARIDWNRWFSRVSLDVVRGLVVLTATSRLHEELSATLDDVVDAGAARALKRLGSARLRAPHEPPGTGMEPDCGFYVDERAEAYRAAVVEGQAAADAFFERTPLDLVVEVEITHADAGKIERYGDIGVRELWRLHGRKGTRDLRAEFFALQPGSPPRPLAASAVLDGLTPDDVCEAADRLRLCVSRAERTEAVARIVRRRRRASVRVRDEGAPYRVPAG